MKLNEKNEIFPFTTNLKVNDNNIEIVKEVKLLGTYITDN